MALVLGLAVCLPLSGHAGEPLDINEANAEELTALNGVGQVLAERIVAYREDHDGFDSVAELEEVDGIGAKTLESLQEKVTVGD
ncbi:MAG: ComEA family DNA-binding protein [Thiohalorhabdus sp.]|uniref:ComEA family DNA-binding protein n=1 Tax=Thiohalorhabdus sp. TaxID=3094134 RepID=UPI0039806913